MNCGDAAGQIRIFYIIETGFTHQGGEAFLVGEFGYGVGKVLIGSARSADGSADAWKDAREVEIESLPKPGNDRRRELENGQFTTRIEDSM